MAEKDFIGFTFDNIHSDELGILRVSDGDRYKEDLQPEIKDLTAEVPGMHGEYYFGSTYGNKEFDIDIAYDSLTEKQFRELRRRFSGREIHELIFDERPYKKYLVKLANPIELSYACFDEPKRRAYGEEEPYKYGVRKDQSSSTGRERIYPWVYEEGMQRVYKGDGTISFVAYYPFAKNVFRTLPSEERCPNVDEWAETSGILSAVDYNDIKDLKPATGSTPAHFKIYNPGDIKTGMRFYCLFGSANKIPNIELTYKYKDNSEGEKIKLTDVLQKGTDVGILINTDTQLVVGLSQPPIILEDLSIDYKTSSNIYNECITEGHFFKLEPNETKEESKLYVSGYTNVGIFYDYLYF